MDVIAHTLWTNALFHLKYHQQRRLRYIAAFFGVAPDLVGFTPVFLYTIFSGQAFAHTLTSHYESANWTIKFASDAYQYTHSLVVFAFCFIIVTVIGNLYLKYKKGPLYQFWVFWPMLGWALHVLIDIPSHKDFYNTPFLFPLSNYHYTHGVSWAHPTYMLINYSLLTLSYVGLFIYQKRKNHQKYLEKQYGKQAKK
jgi:membrane-bound metal-dependent hydrolase YbcI (DUF457 family)